MESGADRPFEERAELAGQGPGVFCRDDYEYLRVILAGSSDAAPSIGRPPCD
jgi:hypothetical protein